MAITALCITLLINVLVVVVAQVNRSYFVQTIDAAMPRIIPDRLQFFEYENFSVHCQEVDGLNEQRVMWKLNKIGLTNSSNCDTSAPSCTIYPAFKRHSGEYWCENKVGERSSAVNITVTDGFVILEIPPHPVIEGNEVILHCRNKKTKTRNIAEFYKDGSLLWTAYASNRTMTIHNVSKSDEGLYKCTISEAGESPESWLAVLKLSEDPYGDTRPPHSESPNLIMLWPVVAVLSVALLLLLGLLLCRKHKGEDSVIDSHHATYAAVKKQKKGEVSGDVTYAVIEQRKHKESEVSREDTKSSSPDENILYSLVTSQAADTRLKD